MGRSRKAVDPQRSRGFESLSHRHPALLRSFGWLAINLSTVNFNHRSPPASPKDIGGRRWSLSHRQPTLLGSFGWQARQHSALSHNRRAMWYVYILKSRQRINWTYVGSTNNLRRRLVEHQTGECASTKPYLPACLDAYVAVRTEAKARLLEKYFKTGSGKAVLKKRILTTEARPPRP